MRTACRVQARGRGEIFRQVEELEDHPHLITAVAGHPGFAEGIDPLPGHGAAGGLVQVGALLVTAGLGSAADHALISLLALNGLRVSEATGADIQALGAGGRRLDRG